MSDFNYEESKLKKGADFEVSSFLNKGSYKGNMHIPPSGVEEVGEVTSKESPLSSYDKKSDSIG